MVTPLPPLLYEGIVRRTLEEDLGRAGDITTDSIVRSGTRGVGRIVARSAGCVAGIEVAGASFRLLDPDVKIALQVRDGDEVAAGEVLCVAEGSARNLLMGERTALNFLGHLSGIAAATHSIVKRIGSSTRVLCTRKTTPGLGVLEKYAVRAGGGFNHRFGLDDGVLIKENHLALVGSIEEAVRRVRLRVGHMVKVEVEVETLDQLRQALNQDIDAVLLDNMSVSKVFEALQLVKGRVLVEVSGGLTLEKALEMAEVGVDLLSIGWLTHSAPALDVAFEVDMFADPSE